MFVFKKVYVGAKVIRAKQAYKYTNICGKISGTQLGRMDDHMRVKGDL